MRPRLVSRVISLKQISILELVKLWLARKVGYEIRKDPSEPRAGDRPDNPFTLALIIDNVVHEIVTVKPRFAAILSLKPDIVDITGWKEKPKFGMVYDGVGFTNYPEESTDGQES